MFIVFQTRTMERSVKEFLESSTIHGLAYISTCRRVARILWIFVIFAGFSGSAFLINQSFSSWSNNPVSTTIETLPISELDFPIVTVCPPKNSFTSLLPDLAMSENINFDDTKRKELSDFVSEAAYNSNHKAKYVEFLAYRTEKYINWYTGTSRVVLPYREGGVTRFNLYSTAPSGSFSSPYFRRPFDEDTFERSLECQGRSHLILHYSMRRTRQNLRRIKGPSFRYTSTWRRT